MCDLFKKKFNNDPEVKDYFDNAYKYIKEKNLKFPGGCRDSTERRIILFTSLPIFIPDKVKNEMDEYIKNLDQLYSQEEIILSEFRQWLTNEKIDTSLSVGTILGDYICWYRVENGKHLPKIDRLIIRNYIENKSK
jgi:hypothetical protein